MKLMVTNQLSEAEQVEYDNDEQTVKVYFHQGCDLEGLDMALELPYSFVLDLFEDMMKKAEVDMSDVEEEVKRLPMMGEVFNLFGQDVIVMSTTVGKDGQDYTITVTATELPDDEGGKVIVELPLPPTPPEARI